MDKLENLSFSLALLAEAETLIPTLTMALLILSFLNICLVTPFFSLVIDGLCK